MNDPASWPWLQTELRATGDRLAASIGALTDLDAPVPDLDWSAAQLIAHIGIIPFHKRDMATRPEPLVFPPTAAGVAALGAERVSHFDDHSPSAIATRLPPEIDATLIVLGDEPDTPVPWYTLSLPARAVGGIMLSELLIHHRDLTGIQALAHERREITDDQARACLHGLILGSSIAVNRDVAIKIPGSYVTRIKGGGSYTLDVAAGDITVSEGVVDRPDLVTTAEPVPMLLASLGRINPLQAALTGKIRTWGRKPWRIPAAASLFRQV